MNTLTADDTVEIRSWFDIYTGRFQSDEPDLQAAVTLKKDHTRRVVSEILAIADSLNLSAQQRYLAEVIALLHDIGRFEQYAQYRTFHDRSSVNHAVLGGEIIEREQILGKFPVQLKDLIISIVTNHNSASPPESGNIEYDFFLQLVRDADKIDILHVVTNYYTYNCTTLKKVIEMDLPDTSGISPGILNDLLKYRIAHVEHLTNLNDFKALQMGWIFDVNFPRSFQIIAKRRYLEKIHASISDHDNADRILTVTKRHLERKLNDAGSFDPLRQ